MSFWGTDRLLARALVIGSLIASLSANPLAGQQEPEATLNRAVAMIQQRDFGAAVEILQKIVEEEPQNARAWSLLGFALHSKGDIDAALEAHLKAAEFEETEPTAMYNAGMAYALKGNLDEAFSWLFQAKATGRINMTQVGVDPDAQNLREDPRYRELFPSPAEYADPFVEEVSVVHEWIGEDAGDVFGWIARNIGDVDGDGSNDVTTSAPFRRIGGELAGKIYTFSGRTGELLWAREGQPGDRLGLGVEAAGDANGDGVPDVVAGAPGGDKTYVYSGRDGSVLLTLYAGQEGESFGRKVTDVGDIDSDGYDDILVGAPLNDSQGEDAGRAYLYSGQDGQLMLELSGERAGDRFGSSVGGYHSPEHTFLIIGAPNAGPEGAGRVYVYGDLSGEPVFSVEADETGAQLGGMFVSVVGDVDGDGVPDIYASDWSNAAKGRSTGRIYVHSGADGRRLLTMTGEAAGDGFGIGTGDAGDVNHDGYDDLIIGAWQHSGAAPSGGKAYLYSGADGSLMRTFTVKVPGETFGFDATGMGDVDGDGVVDLLLTAAWSAIDGPRSGRMFILSATDPETEFR